MDRIRAKFCKENGRNSLDLYSKLGIEAEVANTDLTVSNEKTVLQCKNVKNFRWVFLAGCRRRACL